MFIVMSGVEVAPGKPMKSTLFATNAVGLTEAEATAEAKRRTAAEAEIGHSHITWFSCPDMQEMLAQFRGLK